MALHFNEQQIKTNLKQVQDNLELCESGTFLDDNEKKDLKECYQQLIKIYTDKIAKENKRLERFSKLVSDEQSKFIEKLKISKTNDC